MKLDLRHETTYRYHRPVRLGEHRMMLRPRDSHVLRVVSATVDITPRAELRWSFDVFGNSVAHALFAAPTDLLRIVSRMRIEHYGGEPAFLGLEDWAEHHPFTYDPVEIVDLAPYLALRWPEQAETLRGWTRPLLDRFTAPVPTWDLLRGLNEAIRTGLRYQTRHVEGVQSPAETIGTGAGTCRDFAVLFNEAAKSLGLAARFVSGYLFDPGGHQGAGATHAWSEVYLPGAGWVEFDPTNGIVGNRDLIRIATARDAAQAVPIGGSWTGASGDFDRLDVAVTVEPAEDA